MRNPLTNCGCLVLVAACMISLAASADQVHELYQAQVPVVDKGETERVLALGAALRKVLVKLTGERNPQASPGVVRAMSQPRHFVQQFRYLASPSTEAGSPAQLELWARFDPRAVDDLLREAGLPIWESTRPAVLTWVALGGESGPVLIGVDDRPDVFEVLERSAADRGLPLLVPLLDLEDRAGVSGTDVWSGSGGKILQSSARYRSDIVLVARLNEAGSGVWQASWILFLDAAAQDWSNRGKSLAPLLEDGFNRAADLIARRFAGTPQNVGAEGIPIEVHNVRTLEDYARVVDYLRSLDRVTQVDITRLRADTLSCLLHTRGSSAALRQVIGLGRTLITTDSSAGMQFRLLR